MQKEAMPRINPKALKNVLKFVTSGQNWTASNYKNLIRGLRSASKGTGASNFYSQSAPKAPQKIMNTARALFKPTSGAPDIKMLLKKMLGTLGLHSGAAAGVKGIRDSITGANMDLPEYDYSVFK